jgi:VanZ family protein
VSPPRRARRAADVPPGATGRILAVLAYLALIFTLSSWQHPPAGPAVKHLDKVVHAIEYAGLGVLVYRAVELWSPHGWAGVAAFFLGSCVAGADEIYQARVPGRQSTAADAAADLLGIALGIGLLLWRRRGQEQAGTWQR